VLEACLSRAWGSAKADAAGCRASLGRAVRGGLADGGASSSMHVGDVLVRHGVGAKADMSGLSGCPDASGAPDVPVLAMSIWI
jgi:hypothetical protein